MRTTLKIDDELLKEAKIIAANSGRTISEVFEDALREILLRRQQAKTTERFVLPTFKGEGAQPSVDLEDWASIVELMDREDAGT